MGGLRGDLDGRGEEHGLARVLAVVLDEVGRGAQQQRPSVLAAEHAGKRAEPLRELDLVDDLAAGRDPAGRPAEPVGDPHVALGVQAAAVGREAHLREHLGHRAGLDGGAIWPQTRRSVERAVGGDRERASGGRRTSRRRSACRRRSTIAVREPQVVGLGVHGAVGVDAHEARRRRVGEMHQVEAEVARRRRGRSSSTTRSLR